MKKLVILFISLLSISNNSYAETFGAQKMAQPLDVVRIFTGGTSPVFIQFSGTSMTGCSGDNGGYLKPSWLAANNNVFDHKGTDRLLSVLLYAKATKTKVEVRYRLNTSNPTGWNNCVIEAVYTY